MFGVFVFVGLEIKNPGCAGVGPNLWDRCVGLMCLLTKHGGVGRKDRMTKVLVTYESSCEVLDHRGGVCGGAGGKRPLEEHDGEGDPHPPLRGYQSSVLAIHHRITTHPRPCTPLLALLPQIICPRIKHPDAGFIGNRS